jgi:hypothetical protein
MLCIELIICDIDANVGSLKGLSKLNTSFEDK